MAGIDANTRFLMQMNGDISSHEQISTLYGGMTFDASIKKFGYGSFGFDGSSYINLDNGVDWVFGTSDFTFEFWVYTVGAQGGGTIFSSCHTNLSYNQGPGSWILYFNDATNLRYQLITTTGTKIVNFGNIPTTTWTHIALVRYNDVLTSYTNGVLLETVSVAARIVGQGSGKSLGIGRRQVSTPSYFIGSNIDEIRISNIARYTSDFSASLQTEEFETDANDLYLNHCEGDISFYGHTMDTAGTPGCRALQSKWHGALRLTGSSYLEAPDNSDWNFGTGDFTIDFWTYRTAAQAPAYLIKNSLLCHDAVGGAGSWLLMAGNSQGDTFRFGYTSFTDILVGTTDIVDSTWYHIAVVRSGTTMYLFINGIEEDTTTDGRNFDETSVLTIGASSNPSFRASDRNFNGYIDEVRISSVARWTTDFDLPIAPYSRFTYTVSGDITEDCELKILDSTFDNVIYASDVTAPTYSVEVDDDSVLNVIAIPTSSGIDAQIHRDISPSIT